MRAQTGIHQVSIVHFVFSPRVICIGFDLFVKKTTKKNRAAYLNTLIKCAIQILFRFLLSLSLRLLHSCRHSTHRMRILERWGTKPNLSVISSSSAGHVQVNITVGVLISVPHSLVHRAALSDVLQSQDIFTDLICLL